MNNIADVFYQATFICQQPGGPVDTNGNVVYSQWNLWFVIVFYLSNVQNYVFFLCLYKWWNTYRKHQIKLEVKTLCNKLEFATDEELDVLDEET